MKKKYYKQGEIKKKERKEKEMENKRKTWEKIKS